MERSEQLNELAKALAAAQAEFPKIPKNSTNPFFNSKYADFADVKEAADPVATKHGLSVTQFPGVNDKGDTLVSMLLHSSGQFLQSEMQLHPVKSDPQSQGSALTYAKRYAYAAILGLVADEDDDGNAASQPKQQTQRSKAQNTSSTRPPAAPKVAPKPVADLIAPLNQDQRKEIADKMVNANFPADLDALNNAQQQAVRRWIAALTSESAA